MIPKRGTGARTLSISILECDDLPLSTTQWLRPKAQGCCTQLPCGIAAMILTTPTGLRQSLHRRQSAGVGVRGHGFATTPSGLRNSHAVFSQGSEYSNLAGRRSLRGESPNSSAVLSSHRFLKRAKVISYGVSFGGSHAVPKSGDKSPHSKPPVEAGHPLTHTIPSWTWPSPLLSYYDLSHEGFS